MTLAIATIPDDPARLPRWLEGHMVGGDLRAIAAELAAVHNAESPHDSIREQLGDQLPAVLNRGLSVLPKQKLQLLLRQPYYLLELQEIVLIEGGQYWESLPRPAEFTERASGSKDRIEEALFGRMAEPADEAEPLPIRKSSRYRTLWTIAATAAVVFIATFATSRLMMPPTPAGIAWGWAKANAFPSNLDRRQYLNRLADEADEWFDKRPDSVAAAAKRISEYRQGCTALLLADHPQLNAKDREWLRKQCREWSHEFDNHLNKLEETGNVGAAIAATDDTVRLLSKALRDKAAAV
jgi:hypothetical protein